MADNIPAELVKELREQTGAGVMDCKRALEESHGDFEAASCVLREKGLLSAKKRQDRETNQGAIETYVHIGRQIGAMVELNCETDFVARNSEFLELAHMIALQIAACNPLYLDRDSVGQEVVESQKEQYRRKCASEGKPEHVWDRIIDGLMDKYFQEVCLLEQPFIKEPSMSVGDLVAEVSSKLGEKLVVKRFSRFRVGEEDEES
ncbi:MAG: translation elongation factor Ts [Actinomycetota bacterium]|nr:translation elongation factor Ts [Actinomycetota bacterium]